MFPFLLTLLMIIMLILILLMNKLNKISTSINATRGLAEIEQQVNDIKNSNLTEIEKQKALKSHKQMIKTTLIVTILTCLVATILCGIICNVVEGNLKIILCLIIAGLATIGLISFGLFGRKLFQDFQNAYEKVDNWFDGLTQDVINILKPNNKEELLIKKYKKKMLFCGLLFLLAFGLLFIIISILDIEIYSPITIILALIITGISLMILIMWKYIELNQVIINKVMVLFVKNVKLKLLLNLTNLKNIILYLKTKMVSEL